MSDTYNKLLGLVTSTPKEQPVKKEEENQDVLEKSTNQQYDKRRRGKIKKSESQQYDLSTNQQADAHASTLSTKTSKRFTTYLTKESLREIRSIANNEDKFDYEIFQEAVDLYLKEKGR